MKSAKKSVRLLVDQTREERPYLLPFYENRPKYMMLNVMSASMDRFHKNRMDVVFDAETLTSLHLYDGPTLGKALDSWHRSPVLKSLVKNNGECSPLRFRFTVMHHEVDDKITRENLVNPDTYETIVRDKSAFNVCSFVDMTTSVAVSSYVVKEEIKLRSIKASYALYTESLAILNERMNRFIESENLNECMDVEFLAKRKEVINEWLHARYFDEGQFIQFEDQEAYRETAYTMRQLLTSTGDMKHLLDLMISTTLLSNEPMSTKKTKLIIACQEYKCNAPCLVDVCRHYPQLVRNLHDYTETVKKSPSGPIDIAVVKDDNATLLSMSILDPPRDLIKIVAKRDAKKLFLCESKELLDDMCLIAKRDKLTLDEQCKDVFLPFIDNEVRRFFGPEYGELDICQEVVNTCLKRTDQLATRERGLDGASRAVKGCIMYLMTKAKEVLEERHASEENLYEGSLALKKSKISMEAFDEKKQEAWSFAMKELMRDNENRKELLLHQRQKIDITTLSITMGKETIFGSILPCVNSSYTAYVANNNNIVINNFENKECKKKLRDYHTAMMEIFKEDDAEIQKMMIAKLVESDDMPETKKRKRVASQAAVETPFDTKRLKTKHEKELLDANDEDDMDARPIITIKNKRVPKQEPKGSRKCEFCEIVKPLSSFYNQSKSYAYLRNVCHTCIAHKKKFDKTQK